jgi:hypothetical protein
MAALAFLPYLRDTVTGSVRPRVASWATWSLVTGIATIAALSQHAYTSALLTGVATCIELSVLVMALRKGAYDYSWVDGASQAISLCSIVAWLLSKDATLAIMFNIAADLFGGVPTFYHSWLSPHDEAWQPFLLSSVGAAISFAAVGTISFVAAGFPMYLMLVGLALGLNIYLRQKVVPVKEAN